MKSPSTEWPLGLYMYFQFARSFVLTAYLLTRLLADPLAAQLPPKRMPTVIGMNFTFSPGVKTS